MDPGGSAEEIDKVFLKTCLVDLLRTRIRGLARVYTSLVKGPHENVATYFMTKSSVRWCR
jgi:hypothetical protein